MTTRVRIFKEVPDTDVQCYNIVYGLVFNESINQAAVVTAAGIEPAGSGIFEMPKRSVEKGDIVEYNDSAYKILTTRNNPSSGSQICSVEPYEEDILVEEPIAIQGQVITFDGQEITWCVEEDIGD